MKGEDQPQIASSDEPKLIEPKSDATAPSDQSLQPSSQDTTPSDLAQPEDSKKKKVSISLDFFFNVVNFNCTLL